MRLAADTVLHAKADTCAVHSLHDKGIYLTAPGATERYMAARRP